MNVKCPQCGEKSTVPAEYAGRSVTCPGCHWAMLIPVAAEIESRRPLASALLVLVGAVIGLTSGLVLWIAMDPASQHAASLSSELADTEARAAALETENAKSIALLEKAAEQLAKQVEQDAKKGSGLAGFEHTIKVAGWKLQRESPATLYRTYLHESGAVATFGEDAMGVPFASLTIDGQSSKQGEARDLWWIGLIANIDDGRANTFMDNAKRIDEWSANPQTKVIRLKGAFVDVQIAREGSYAAAIFTAYLPE